MDNINNQTQELSYAEGINEILISVLSKYKLEETEEEGIKKLETDQMFSGEIVMNIIKDLIFERIQEKELTSLFQQKLNIDAKRSEELTIDIKNQILPLIKKAPPQENQLTENTNSPSFIKQTPIVNVEENANMLKFEREKIETIKAVDIANTNEIKEKVKKFKKPILPNKINTPSPQPPSQPSKQDSYRESIE